MVFDGTGEFKVRPYDVGEVGLIAQQAVAIDAAVEAAKAVLEQEEIAAQNALNFAISQAEGDEQSLAPLRAALSDIKSKLTALNNYVAGTPTVSIAGILMNTRGLGASGIRASTALTSAVAARAAYYEELYEGLSAASKARIAAETALWARIDVNSPEFKTKQAKEIAWMLADGDKEVAEELEPIIASDEGKTAIAARAAVEQNDPEAARQAKIRTASNKEKLQQIMDNPQANSRAKEVARDMLDQQLYTADGAEQIIKELQESAPDIAAIDKQFAAIKESRAETKRLSSEAVPALKDKSAAAQDSWAAFVEETSFAMLTSYQRSKDQGVAPSFTPAQIKQLEILDDPSATKEEKTSAAAALVMLDETKKSANQKASLATEEGRSALTAAAANVIDRAHDGEGLLANVFSTIQNEAQALRNDAAPSLIDRTHKMYRDIRRKIGLSSFIRTELEYLEHKGVLTHDTALTQFVGGKDGKMTAQDMLDILAETGITTKYDIGQAEKWNLENIDRLNTIKTNDLENGAAQLGAVEVLRTLREAALIKTVRTILPQSGLDARMHKALGGDDGVLNAQEAIDVLKQYRVEFEQVDTAAEMNAVLTDLAKRNTPSREI